MAKTVRVIPATINRVTLEPISSTAKRKVAGYARVSTDLEEQQSSYEAQVSYYTNYIKSRDDWEFVDVYTDEGISATSTKHRDGFQRMVEDALDGKIDLIVTKSVSRFARNTVDSLSTIRTLKEHGTEVYFEKENIWTFDSKGELLLTIMSSLAQEESRSISENVRWGQRKKAADGKYTLPFERFLGYDKGPDGAPVINEEQAVIVRRIYGLYLQGYSILKIAKILTAEKIPTPAGKAKWSDQTVHSILTNEVYMGDKILQKTYSLDFLHKERIRNKGEVPMYHIEQDHDAIIPPATFQRVQDEMERRRSGPHTGDTIFSGKIFCGDCGKFYGPKVWHSNDKYRKVIWQCAHKYHGQRTCTTPHVYEDGIKEAFIRVCNQLGDGRDEVVTNLREVQAIIGGTETLGKQKVILLRERDHYAELLQNLIDQNARVAQDQKAYSEQYDGLYKRYASAETELQELEKSIQSKEMRQRQIAEFIAAVEALPETVSEFQSDLWATLVDHVTVYGKKDVRFTMTNGTEIRA